jgi:hypothetical protein
MPGSIKPQLLDKIQKYTKAQWWVEGTTDAQPMLCLFKKDKQTLQTVIDLQKRNENTVKDLTPFPDQDEIRESVVQVKFHSKLDMTSAYKQIQVNPDHVHKTSFQTVFGTFFSHVMHLGDCNTLSTFQRLMMRLFQLYIGRGIFVYSDTVQEHDMLLGEVLCILQGTKLFLSEKKVELYADCFDCLGHVIDDTGIHADEDKMMVICHWPTLQMVVDIQRFLGLVQYMVAYMPDLTAYTTPLYDLTQKGRPFVWTPLHDQCMETVQGLAAHTPELQPINPALNKPTWSSLMRQ